MIIGTKMISLCGSLSISASASASACVLSSSSRVSSWSVSGSGRKFLDLFHSRNSIPPSFASPPKTSQSITVAREAHNSSFSRLWKPLTKATSRNQVCSSLNTSQTITRLTPTALTNQIITRSAHKGRHFKPNKREVFLLSDLLQAEKSQRYHFPGEPMAASSTDVTPKIWPRICLFGDSITRRSMDPEFGCWGSLLAYQVNDLFDVSVRGFEGYTTRMALPMMPQLFPREYLNQTELMVIFFGHNDQWETDPFNTPLEEYKENLRQMVKYLNENGMASEKIILITPAWYHKPDFDEFCKSQGLPPTGKQLGKCRAFSEAVLELGRKLSIEVLDFFEPTAAHEPLNELFCDGVHFSQKGAALLHEKLLPIVERKVEASFGKPLKEIKQVTPFDQRPEVVAAFTKYFQSLSKS